MANYISNPPSARARSATSRPATPCTSSRDAAYIHKAGGHFAGPTSINVSRPQARHAEPRPDAEPVGVYNAPEANAYPLASYSYLITPTSGFDPAKGAVLGKWIIYIACAGQRRRRRSATRRCRPNLVQAVFYGGEPDPRRADPPALTPTACPNPTITGQGYGGGGYPDYVTRRWSGQLQARRRIDRRFRHRRHGIRPEAPAGADRDRHRLVDPRPRWGLTALDPSTITTLTDQERLDRYKPGLLVGAATADREPAVWIAAVRGRVPRARRRADRLTRARLDPEEAS